MGLFDALKPAQYADIPEAPDAYTNNVWQAQATLYRSLWDVFNRDIFDEVLNKKKNVKKYPLGINLYETACAVHRAALFGEFNDDVLRFRVMPPKNKNDDSDEVEAAIDRIWVESGRNSLLLEGAMLCKILGGVVFRPMWNPVLKRLYVRLLQPDAFFPVWDPNDYHEIMECYVSYMVDAATALRKYNVHLDDDRRADVQVFEHWTRDYYEVLVDGKEAYWDKAHQFKMGGANPYKDPWTGRGTIPFEYFPSDRAGSFYGTPLGKNMLQMQNEYNLRMADLGDATMEAAHKYLFVSNRPKGIRGLERLKRGRLNDLGMGAPGQRDPEVNAVAGGDVPESSVRWLQSLKNDARMALFTPAVAYGEDEGSQRSALTLAFRMWPLTQAVRTTRGFWSDSFYHLHRKMVIVASTYEKNGYKLEKRHTEYRFAPVWSPMLPRDRAQEVNEVTIRKSAGLISTRRGLELLEERESEFIDEEEERIKKDLDAEADRLAMGQQFGQSGQGAQAPKKMPTS